MKKEVPTDNPEIQKIIRQYYEQLYANKMDNLEEMQIHRKVHLPRLNQEEREIMSNPITNIEIETVIKNLPKKQKPKNRWLHREILSTIREKLMSIFLKLSAKITEAVTLSNSFYEANITLIPKPNKDATFKKKKKILQANITGEHRCKNP